MNDLQFQPPPDWLIQQYINRPNPAVEALQGAQSIIKQYADAKDAKQKEALAQQAKDIEMAKGLAGNGQDFLDAYKQVIAARTPTPKIPFSTPRAPSALGGSANPDTVNPQANEISPFIAHSVNVMGHPDITGHMAQQPVTAGVDGLTTPPMAQPPTPSTGTVPSPMTTNVATDPTIQEYQKDPTAFKKQHGAVGMAKLKTQAELDKLMTEKGPLQTITKEKALADGTFNPSKQMIVEPPAPRLDLGTKQDQFDQKEWDKIVKDANPNTARGTNPLGAATLIMDKANTAIQTLSKPVVTYQEAGNAMSDIASIYQRGSPTQFGMQHQEYSTLYGKVQGAIQSLTGNPQDALPNAIKQRLLDDVNGLKTLNSKVVNRNLDYMEKAQPRIINKYKDEWTGIRQSLQSGGLDGDSGVTNTGSSDLVHLSTKDLMALRDKLTAHQSNGN